MLESSRIWRDNFPTVDLFFEVLVKAVFTNHSSGPGRAVIQACLYPDNDLNEMTFDLVDMWHADSL